MHQAKFHGRLDPTAIDLPTIIKRSQETPATPFLPQVLVAAVAAQPRCYAGALKFQVWRFEAQFLLLKEDLVAIFLTWAWTSRESLYELLEAVLAERSNSLTWVIQFC